MIWIQAVEDNHLVLALNAIVSLQFCILHIKDRYKCICIFTGLEIRTLVILAFDSFVFL